ncbi:MAG TPA: dienelactone hydrolase family protein [Vicinamibacterales bacterium]|nr:dienelactone hydrolase family protein [Vicinamibacterales bacterium]
MTPLSETDPHLGQPVLTLGPEPSSARLTMIMLHGRGASAEDILALGGEFGTTDVAFLAPQAAGRTWYPYSFLAPLEDNEPGITSGLRVIAALVDSLVARQVPYERIGLLGFSQGACLSLEFAARHPQPYAAIVGLSGGLIGPPGTPRDYAGSLAGAPVFLGCSDVDAHIPLARVRETADVFRRMGAPVDERIYPRMGHTVNQDEIRAVNALLLSNPRHGYDT